jgi:hypothetical protein
MFNSDISLAWYFVEVDSEILLTYLLLNFIFNNCNKKILC